MPSPDRSRRAVLATAAIAVSALLVSSCGGDGRTALAIDEAHWDGTDVLSVSTECATDVEVEVGSDHSGAGLPEVTVWGTPALGRCRPTVTVALPPGTTRVVDGTTSMVVDLPPAPR